MAVMENIWNIQKNYMKKSCSKRIYLQHVNINKTQNGGKRMKIKKVLQQVLPFEKLCRSTNRGNRIWTCDLTAPSRARYQTTPYPVDKEHLYRRWYKLVRIHYTICICFFKGKNAFCIFFIIFMYPIEKIAYM